MMIVYYLSSNPYKRDIAKIDRRGDPRLKKIPIFSDILQHLELIPARDCLTDKAMQICVTNDSLGVVRSRRTREALFVRRLLENGWPRLAEESG